MLLNPESGKALAAGIGCNEPTASALSLSKYPKNEISVEQYYIPYYKQP